MKEFYRIAAAVLLLSLAGAAGADLERGFQAYQQGDFHGALSAWMPLAREGNPVAQFNLGQMYRLGKGIEQNDHEAAKWYVMAANQGSTYAEHNLQLMFRDGRISREEFDAAFGVGAASLAEATSATAGDKLAADSDVSDVKAIATDTQGETWDKSTATEAVAMIEQPSANRGAADGWLAGLDAGHYLVQLLAAPTRASVDQFVADNRDSVPAGASVVRTSSKDQDWFVLLMGPFTSQEQAGQAVQLLPDVLRRNEPWVRSVSSVQTTAQ